MNFSGFKRPLPRRYFLYGTGLALLLLVACAGLFLLWYKPAPEEVALSGSSAGLGMQYGEALGVKMKLLTRVYLDGIICQNNPNLIQGRRAKALETLQHWPTVYFEELQAMAKASGLESGALAYANSFLDLGQAQAGCRSVVLASNNCFLHAHNLDWDNLGGLGRWTTCIIRRRPADGRLATVSVGFPGLIGALDIINEKGLALSFNQLGVGRGQVTEPVFIMMRRIAETCVSLEQARREIGKAPAGMPFIITVSDAAAGTAAIFERTRDKVSERPLANGWGAACNVNQGTTVGHTRLDQVMAQTHVTSPTELQQVLRHPDVLLGCNIYSVIFDFRHNQLLLASGAVPAAVEHFRTFSLFH